MSATSKRRMRASRSRRPSSHAQAVTFFMRHAGFNYRRGEETRAQGKRRGAVALARAEAEAARRGWRVRWEDDPEPYEMGDAETETPSEVLSAVLYDADGEVLASLCGIADPSRDYGRVVEAELALEALS